MDIKDIDSTHIAAVGGKAAHLGELSRIEGIRVPPGFCVPTDAFDEAVAQAPSIDERLDRLSRTRPDDHETIRALSAGIRAIIEGVAIPDDVAAAISRELTRVGDGVAYAVRSSATAEDLPGASFAGQHDTFLNVAGTASILEHVRRCWASLFTERAVTYRLRNGIDHRTARMAVVVQQMVAAQASGVLFTADPVTGHRKVVSIEAAAGLGEALVSGLVNADVYKVRDGGIVENAHVSGAAILTAPQVLQLAELGRRIEAHFGRPQDIEWCLADGDLDFVQSRPITTLFPIPDAGDNGNHVYISVGHQQMMTDAMKPLGLSFWQLTTPRRMAEAGGRLFVDVTQLLASPATRESLLTMAGRSDPLIGDALRAVVGREDFIRASPDGSAVTPAVLEPSAPIDPDPAIVPELIARTETSIAAVKREIQTRTGTALLDFILEDLQELKRILFHPQSHQVIMAAMESTWWLNDHLEAWLGEKNAADALAQSAPHNVTSEMGLALLDVADAIRPHPEVVAFLEEVDEDSFLSALPGIAGGHDAREAIQAWLDKYGMRGVGEIDITRPRWSERPAALVPLILNNVRNFDAGAGKRRFEHGLDQARMKEQEILERVRALPDGERKAEQAKRMIDRVRTFIGFREYPKYGKICRYFAYKQALMDEAGRLVQAGVLREKEDIFYLRFHELQDVVHTRQVDEKLIRRRKDEFGSYRSLMPPRVLTSDGESVTASYRRENLPAGALAGLPVSAGTVEGRARVINDLAEADLEPGDILVTTYTDPSWTPLFVGIKGLVTEVGGLMTHGAVIAREYGLPAVVGVEGATRLIRDGQQIRVHGTHGYVEILP